MVYPMERWQHGGMEKEIVSINSFTFTGREIPQELPLIMSGEEIIGVDGRTYRNPSPHKIVERFNERGLQLPFDIEHSTQKQGGKGLPAPAVGWIKSLYVDETGAVIGRIEWLDEGIRLIEIGAYKYYSPAYGVTEDRTIKALVSAGFTNCPNLPVPALNREEGDKGEDMDLKVACNALGLKVDATESEVLTEINSLRTRTADAEARAQEAEARLSAMENEQLTAEINSAINKAVEEGKVTPAQKSYFTETVKTREELNSFKAMAEKTEARVEGKSSKAQKKLAGVELNEEESSLIEQLGISKEAFIAAKEDN